MDLRHHGWCKVFRSPFCFQVSWISTVVSVCQRDQLFKYENPLNHRFPVLIFISHPWPAIPLLRGPHCPGLKPCPEGWNHCWTALSNFLSSLQNVGNSLFMSVQGFSIGRLAITHGHKDLGRSWVIERDFCFESTTLAPASVENRLEEGLQGVTGPLEDGA